MVSLAVVVALSAVGIWEVRPPAPAGASAPAGAFSAARAQRDLAWLGRLPRPLGSVQHDLARDYVRARLAAAGFAVRVHAMTTPVPGDASAVAHVANVVGVLPGTGRGRLAVLLVAHYDSVAASPGGADDASGLAVLLEVARAAAAGPRLADDLVVLFTDGEEDRLLGLNAFLRSSLASRVGLVLNFDNAGSSGPSIMYQTSSGNAPLVAAFSRATSPLVGSSLSDALVRRRSVESDFTPLRTAGYPGMSFGLSEGFYRNHTWLDTVDTIEPASLQHQGEQALALVRDLGAHPLDPLRGGRDVVYFGVVGGRLVVYSPAWVLPLVGVAAALLAGVLLFGVRRRAISGYALVAGSVNSLLTLILMGALLGAFWGFGWQDSGGDATSAGYATDVLHRAGFTLLVLGIGLALRLWGFDEERALEGTLGSAIWWLLLCAYVAVALPGGSYLLVWPLIASLLSLAFVVARGCPSPADEHQPVACLVALLAGVAPGLLLFSSSVYVLITVRGMRLVVIVVGVWLMLGALLPLLALLRPRVRRVLPLLCGIAGAAIVIGLSPVTGLVHDPSPKGQLLYAYDADRVRGHWATFRPMTDASLVRLVWPTGGWEADPADPTRSAGLAAASGPQVRLPCPRVVLLRDRLVGGRRDVRLGLGWTPRTALATLVVRSDVGRLAASIDGLPLVSRDTGWPDASGAGWHLVYFQPPDNGATLHLRIARGRRLDLRLVAFSRGLPDRGAAHISRDGSLGPSGDADLTVVEASYRLGPRVGDQLATGPAGT